MHSFDIVAKGRTQPDSDSHWPDVRRARHLSTKSASSKLLQLGLPKDSDILGLHPSCPGNTCKSRPEAIPSRQQHGSRSWTQTRMKSVLRRLFASEMVQGPFPSTFSCLHLVVCGLNRLSVPSGGYTASCMLAAANLHLSERGQTDTLAAHFEYPSRAAPGVAIIKIEDIKLGGQISTLHVTLWQGGIIPQTPWVRPGESRRVVLAYTTHTHLASLSGVTLPTGFESSKAGELPGLPDFELLNTSSHGTDGTWRLAKLPAVARTIARSLAQWSLYLPCQGPLSPGVLDMWMRLSSGERITQGALAYVVDSFPVRTVRKSSLCRC